MKIYTYRFMWKIKDSSNICFKVITDTESGLEQFEKALLALDNLDKASKEYLSEMDCSKIGIYENIFGGE